MTCRSSALSGTALVIASVVAVQGSAALAETIFDVVEPAGVVAWRQIFGAITLLTISAVLTWRRGVQGLTRVRTAGEWGLVLGLGIAMATMNMGYYYAVQALPLGVAATLMFLGPFAVAVMGSRSWRQVALAVVALVGVVLVTRPSGDVTVGGVGLGLLAGAALAAYTLFSGRMGQRSDLDNLALATAVSALFLTPTAASHAGEPGPQEWLMVVLLGAIGVTVTFMGDFFALRLVGTRVVATLFSLDPVIGAVIGIAFLAEYVSLPQLLGIVCIAGAGAVAAATAGTKSVPSARQVPRDGRGESVNN